MDLDTALYLLLLSLIAIATIIFTVKLFRVYESTFKRTPRKIVDISRLPKGEFTFDAIVNEFLNLKEVSSAIRKAGLEHCQLILGIDFTASNEWQGRRTFSHKSLHALSDKVNERYGRRGSLHHLAFFRDNPYQKVISVLGQTLEPLDDDNLIPAFGFGDSVTKDKAVFSLSGELNKPCKGFEEVLSCYKEVVRNITMSGPTNFVPILTKALEIVKRTGEYHILVIIADGQVSEEHDKATRRVIIEASWYPLSIILVGVGDGPWDVMNSYDDKIRGRQFDNFQFVNYHSVTRRGWRSDHDLTFALHALMEIPDQYKAIRALGLMENLQKDLRLN